MTEPLAMTKNRLSLLTVVNEGQIRFDPRFGRWMWGEASVAGWDGRTLSELRRHGYISVNSTTSEPPYTVDLTDQGRSALNV